MKSVWSGSIGFGLVNIPIKLFGALESKRLDLDMLDKKDHSNIRYLRVNEKTGKEVEWKDIVKGYNLNGEYVILENEDFESASIKKTELIEIKDFVLKEEIDIMYYENPYYVVPDPKGVTAYHLLREAMFTTAKVGVGSFVMRNKEALAVLRATDKVLTLHRIHFEDEIRKPEQLEIPERKEIKKAELKMAISIIDQLTQKFDISKYHDTYTSELMKVINEKSKGIKHKPQKLKIVHKTQDLMEQLKASLELKQKKAS